VPATHLRDVYCARGAIEGTTRGKPGLLDELVIVDNNQDKDFWRRSRRRFEPGFRVEGWW